MLILEDVQKALAEVLRSTLRPDNLAMDISPAEGWSGLHVTLDEIKGCDNGGLILNCHVVKAEGYTAQDGAD